MRPAEVRRALGISTATYFRWLRDGRLKGVRIGRRWRFPASAIGELAGGAADGAIATALEQVGRLLRSRGVPTKEVARMTDRTRGAEGLVMALLAHANAGGATHLHLEPCATGLAIRERIDGVLAPAGETLPRDAAPGVAAAIRHLAGLDAVGAGRFFADVGGSRLEVRAATYPTGLGESIAMTLLDPDALVPPLAKLGFPAKLSASLAALMRRDRGLIIVNGPTGSGKTTTLYAMLRELKGSARKIMTAEDPVELTIEGAQQADLAASAMTWVQAIRLMAMSDVNVALVSELRDAETIRATLQLAAAGHLVLTVMHAPDAATAVQRLCDVGGLSRAVVADTLLAVLNQRLLPLGCTACRRRAKLGPSEAAALRLDPADARRDVAAFPGCNACRNTGIASRTAVGELMTMTPRVRKAIESGADTDALREASEPGALRDAVLARIFAGEAPASAAVL